MKTVFLYAGQGSQINGMGRDFYEAYDIYRQFIDGLENVSEIKYLMHESPLEELSKTENTQPCLAAFAAGVTRLLKNRGIMPEAVSGLSLGEYSALHCAGVFSGEDLVRITSFRGQEMTRAAEGYDCRMCAVVGAERELVEEVCEAYGHEGYVTVANYNCPGQYVICGDRDAVDLAEADLQAKGKRCVSLNVSGPFHTRYMAAAGESLKKYFDKIDFKKPMIPVAMNVTGGFLKDDENIKELLVQQVQRSVRMEDDLAALLSVGATDFYEIGPGKVLSGFVRKTAKKMGIDINVYSISSVSDYRKLTGE